ncbi:hypothetical protein A3G67_03350 [Candidatus Roizmanbacteria bacterium RIFCSPLOWO2_12_FULL_40_12]|uniref:26 kDa periplasmic immunogenic protein n=1 Tax=Candidatus Roizmanbacteria bacterium RIFCSPLOWO2_01_FULL_40_42 TaxID=1802066 RepID=A0A1F7J5H7_9BACT|nr:MAG: hypothetical protein A2779_02985 [Candidatus Roizmanbacteria bacterium RIFCSPHIGHO2_01_FULL_40_98]OGK28307.1 MAG: hypothetical protein A3C31_00350 [Candidatus Roizmanbacteria bacterium RIFCSPHIGHO2_02_FULL_40_53]OGK30543.1 MAG: hypothetical protein A2W49_03035 [Candidatus Roizmanbacteria bacterium RIFCSPHIGHO2_12_41_18]OGK36957.1 MAG: hypothetical protein A3E69_00610 [Candidatus Roizmanbacteria bacterium RIFCSPHIGHO2_12_FULL_40_130]OGK50863.1 MAG: hypothetical protein A3B50_01120 [Candi
MHEDRSIKNTGKILLLVLITLFLIKVLNLSYPLSIITSTRSSELSVVGEGKIEATPNLAYIDTGINVNNAASVNEVQNNLDKVNNAVLQAVQKLGIKKQDISTSNYSINPSFAFEGGVDRISGYNGNVTITVKVRDTQQVSKVLEAVTKAGANQVQGVRFEIANPDKLREEARNKAIQNAKEQAKRLAKTLGIRLGKVVNIVEVTAGQGPQPFMERYAADGVGGMGGGGPQVEPGTQTVSSTVTLFFEKK